MNLEDKIISAEDLLKSLSDYEKKGLDTSSLKIFIKNLKTFNKIQKARMSNYSQRLSLGEKLNIIKSFLEDKKAFPRISDVIEFANKELSLGFKDQKESRAITINRIIGRIERSPVLKDQLKESVIRIRNQEMHGHSAKPTKKDKEKAESYARWAEILINI
ncbi:hypothetical protein EV198_2750 [Roseivirga ehrenbergii]|uniref:Uncharacterized protein n=2 Tax=Roseivirga ehrenbergii (strain DSM 102268 / JCM 13514 / KCTC 12282 / NCIMB 14502 / KMM 6017) TaxID=279360 RepID=A0A150XTY2_ROSEK|nr:hypothetical protein MB14_01690 [Roseivirga ehrenbergii]TCL01958.1 hypothetical protein EV198_2750 [Roseivirga ehrenbergii]